MRAFSLAALVVALICILTFPPEAYAQEVPDEVVLAVSGGDWSGSVTLPATAEVEPIVVPNLDPVTVAVPGIGRATVAADSINYEMWYLAEGTVEATIPRPMDAYVRTQIETPPPRYTWHQHDVDLIFRAAEWSGMTLPDFPPAASSELITALGELQGAIGTLQDALAVETQRANTAEAALEPLQDEIAQALAIVQQLIQQAQVPE